MPFDVQTGSLDSLIDTLARDLGAEAARAYAARGLFGLAIPGGSVAVNGFPTLAALPFEWDRTHLFWVDERAVPPSDPESNYALARSLWLDPAGVPPASIHRMPADRQDLAAAAVSYGDELMRILAAPARLDFVLLGVGADGHVASLFPRHAATSERRQLVVPVVDAPKAPARRLTLTLPVLAGAGRVVVMALGASKSAVMREALEHEESTLPVSLVLRQARRPLVLLDHAVR